MTDGFTLNVQPIKCHSLYDALIKIMNKFSPLGKMAIMVSTNKAIDDIQDYITRIYKDIEIGIFTSRIKNKEERMKELEKDLILTTEKSFGTGTNVPELITLVNIIPYKSKIYAKQFQGRLDRGNNNPNLSYYYIEVLDEGFTPMMKQYKIKKDTLRKNSKRFIECDI